MIQKIIMKSVASYNDVGVEIETGHRLNFIFGYNGSGKSTIAKFLYNESLPIEERKNEFTSCKIFGYNHTAEDILVYDESFKKRNFIVNDEQKGIFTLSEQNDKIDKQIKVLRDRRKIYEHNNESSTVKHFDRLQAIAQEQLDKVYNYCWNAKKPFLSFIKADLKFPGTRPKAYKMINDCLAKGGDLRTWNELYEEYQKLYEKDYHIVDANIDMDLFYDLINIQEKLIQLLDKIIVGNKDIDIAKLIDQLHIEQWVHSGVTLLETSPDTCPFCQQEIKSDRLENLKNQFSKYFDKTFEENIDKIKYLGNDYYSKLKLITDNLKSITKQYNPESLVSSINDRIMDSWRINQAAITEKINKPNEKKELVKLDHFTQELDKLEKAINENNKRIKESDDLKKNWIRDCWIYYSNECKNAIEQYKINFELINKCRSFLEMEKKIRQDKITKLTKSIEHLLTKTTNTSDAKDKINKLLKSVGFTSFSIEEKGSTDSGISTYHLKRRKSITTSIYESLSEGEKTFVSFLYFFYLCLGADNPSSIAKRKIIVLDDPVSSLDSQILFVISILFMKLAKKQTSGNTPNKSLFENRNIEQIFVLTHNFYFYKEITIKQRPLCNDKYFLMLEKYNDETNVQMVNEVMKTDYTLLWDSLKKAKVSLVDTDKSYNIFIANTMRRIIDSYIDFIGMAKTGKNSTWTALDKMDEESEERIVASALVSLINDESHSISPLDDIYYDNIVRRKPSLLFDVFEKIFKSIGENHYNMMMDIE